MTFNPYRILGLTRAAAQDEIKSAYRTLARKHHPDSCPGDPRAEDHFKEIANAYGLLSDPVKRRKFDAGEIDAQGKPYVRNKPRTDGYDTYKRSTSSGFGNAQTNGPGHAKKGRFNNFFNNRQSVNAKGADVNYTLKVTFIEAAAGIDKSIRMTTGKTIKVQIPKGTENGQVLRLKNQGMASLVRGLAGDALVEILILEDSTFYSKGLDVHSEEAVTLSEALLGGRIEARTIHGPVIVTVPENSNSGTKLRLKGRGLQRPNTTNRGDHYVTLKVVLPHKEDINLKKFVKKWAARTPYSVRKETLKTNAAE